MLHHFPVLPFLLPILAVVTFLLDPFFLKQPRPTLLLLSGQYELVTGQFECCELVHYSSFILSQGRALLMLRESLETAAFTGIAWILTSFFLLTDTLFILFFFSFN